ncbi:MAG TPA: HAMP domain-containing sensor histidine kinase, partial [Labilithrix sp.]|nr:HAMP domain-containing sensor histidine kinase [Labilithrix sp.]
TVAHVPSHLRDLAGAALEPLVAEVVATGEAVTSLQSPRAGHHASSAALSARQALGASWLVCAPLGAPEMRPLGSFTVFGARAQERGIAKGLACDLARLIGVAIANHRTYSAALMAAREREHILALVAHELRNPLAVVLMAAARASAAEASEGRSITSQRELDLIFRSAKRMHKLVSDLLDVASIDAGRLSMEATACAPHALLHGAICDMTPLAAAAGVALVEDYASELPSVWGDGGRIEQVLVNLLTNAIKFTPRGGRVRVRASRVESEVVIAVEDSGRGIPPADLERVFDRFWQASDTARLGTGLGLEISKSIVERSGGRIWAQSTVGVGTTFYVSIPVAS